MSTIEIRDVGPIAHLSLPIPTGGGLVILKGANGSGKSNALRAVDSLLHGQGGVEARDGMPRGEISGLGVRITVAKSVRHHGELEAVALEDSSAVAELVDPGIKDPDKADVARIKALCRVARAKPDAAPFRALLADQAEFERHVTPDDLAGDDLVAIAARIKRRLEAAARSEESQCEHALGHANAHREAAGEISPDALPIDTALLTKALESRIVEETKLAAEAKHAASLRSNARIAEAALADAEAEYDGPTVAHAIELERDAARAEESARDRVAAAERELADARAVAANARVVYAGVIRERKQAEQHAAAMEQWRQSIAAGANVAAVSDDMLNAARAAVAETRHTLQAADEQNVLIRKAHEHRRAAEQSQATADQHGRKAKQLREAARGTDDVLSAIVAQAGVPLKVDGGRLVLAEPRGAHHFYFGDLSEGERWKIAIDLAVEFGGPGVLFTCPQTAFEGLDGHNRRAIVDHLRDVGAVMVTAEADDGELRAESL